MFKSKMQNR